LSVLSRQLSVVSRQFSVVSFSEDTRARRARSRLTTDDSPETQVTGRPGPFMLKTENLKTEN